MIFECLDVHVHRHLYRRLHLCSCSACSFLAFVVVGALDQAGGHWSKEQMHACTFRQLGAYFILHIMSSVVCHKKSKQKRTKWSPNGDVPVVLNVATGTRARSCSLAIRTGLEPSTDRPGPAARRSMGGCTVCVLLIHIAPVNGGRSLPCHAKSVVFFPLC